MATSIFHISDVHFGVEDRVALDEVAGAIIRERPDVLICTGDLTQRAKHEQYEAAARWFLAIDIPVVLAPGNHDMPYFNLWERFTDPYRRYRRLQERVASGFSSPDVVLVPLKTTVRAQRRFPWSDGVVTRGALRQTLEELSCLADDPRHKLVVAHHPLLGPADKRRNPTIGGERAFAALAAAGADLMLSGHVHVPFDQMRMCGDQQARMIGAGTLSTRLRDGAPASYQVITCEKGKAIQTQMRLIPAPAR